VTKTAAFWDASALVPLCVREAASRHAHMQLKRFQPVVWWGSLVEIHSAICRLHREKEITDSGKAGALARLQLLSRSWGEILPGDEIRELATEALDKYFLRAADSFQMAAALIWCEERTSKRSFVCADQRLAKAAGAAGFSVVGLPTAAP
jgi:predicted nucleic acid-binding protein